MSPTEESELVGGFQERVYVRHERDLLVGLCVEKLEFPLTVHVFLVGKQPVIFSSDTFPNITLGTLFIPALRAVTKFWSKTLTELAKVVLGRD